MSKENAIQSFYYSFFSRKFYAIVAYRWKGNCLKILFVWCLLVAALYAVVIHFGLDMYAKKYLNDLLIQIPYTKIQNGKLETESAKEYRVIHPKSNQLLAIIDMTKTDFASDWEGAYLYAIADRMAIRQDDKNKDVQNFKDFPTVALTQENLRKLADWVLKWIAVILFPIILFSTFIINLITVFALSLVTRLWSRVMGMDLEYWAMFRLTVIAMLPVWIFFIALDGVKLGLSFFVPFESILFMIAANVYLYFAVDAVKKVGRQ